METDNFRQIFKPQTLNNINGDVVDLFSFLKYGFGLNTELKNRLWEEAGEERTKYNELIKLELEKNPLYTYFQKNGITPQDRFSPVWFDNIFNFYKKTINESLSLSQYKIFPTLIVNGTKNNGNETDWNEFISSIKNIDCDEEEKECIISHKKESVANINKNQMGSCCNTHYLEDKKSNSKIPVRVLTLNPYISPICTLQTIWHETTHWIQATDKELMNKNYFFQQKEQEINRKIEELEGAKKQLDTNEYNKRLTDIKVIKNNLDDEYLEIKLFKETQANLNGSMITFIQAIINNCENLEYVERELTRTADFDPEGGYCDFLLTTEILKKLKTDKNFLKNFVEEDNTIKFDVLYQFTAQKTREQINEIIEFAKDNNKKTYAELLKDRKLLEDENNPLVKIEREKQKYWKENPESKIEVLQMTLHRFKGTKNYNEYEKVIKEIQTQQLLNLNSTNNDLKIEKNTILPVKEG